MIDVSTIAKEEKFNFPVAVTDTVWEQYICWTEEDTKRKQIYQDMDTRLRDVLYMLFRAVKSSKEKGNTLLYQLYVVPRKNDSIHPQEITLKSVVSGGDQGEPVITIMLPDED